MPQAGSVFISVNDADKARILPAMRKFVEMGFKLVATGGTQRYFDAAGFPGRTLGLEAEKTKAAGK
jgi:carbamoyl-phosphate synthase large subunit